MIAVHANSGDVGYCLTASAQGSLDAETETLLVAHALRGEGFDASEDGTGRGTPLVPVAFDSKGSQVQTDHSGAAPTLRAMGHVAVADGGGQLAVAFAFGLSTQQEPKWADGVSPSLALPSKSGGGQTTAVAYDMRGREGGAMLEGPHETANIRAADGGSSRSYVAEPWAVRRLTPVECERLMGFPDGFTQIPWRKKPAENCPDGRRYKSLGNSWAVNCADWIGERIAEVDGWI